MNSFTAILLAFRWNKITLVFWGEREEKEEKKTFWENVKIEGLVFIQVKAMWFGESGFCLSSEGLRKIGIWSTAFHRFVGFFFFSFFSIQTPLLCLLEILIDVTGSTLLCCLPCLPALPACLACLPDLLYLLPLGFPSDSSQEFAPQSSFLPSIRSEDILSIAFIYVPQLPPGGITFTFSRPQFSMTLGASSNVETCSPSSLILWQYLESGLLHYTIPL